MPVAFCHQARATHPPKTAADGRCSWAEVVLCSRIRAGPGRRWFVHRLGTHKHVKWGDVCFHQGRRQPELLACTSSAEGSTSQLGVLARTARLPAPCGQIRAAAGRTSLRTSPRRHLHGGDRKRTPRHQGPSWCHGRAKPPLHKATSPNRCAQAMRQPNWADTHAGANTTQQSLHCAARRLRPRRNAAPAQ